MYMKQNKFKFLAVMTVFVLLMFAFVGCSKPTVYHAVFKADGETVEIVDIVDGKLSKAEPSVPSKTGYSGQWESYSTENGDVVVNAVYSPTVYIATFIFDNQGNSETRTFTVESATIDAPDVPQKDGYSGEWENFSVRAEDFTVRIIYTPIPYTVSFMSDDVLIGTSTYTIDDRNIDMPDVPSKNGFTGEWSEFDLSEENLPVPSDITVTALYTSENATSGLYYSSESDTEYGVWGISGNGEDLTIAEIYRNKHVTKVNPRASSSFAFRGSFGTFIIPSSVKELCDYSFSNCTIDTLVIMNPNITIDMYLYPAISPLSVNKLFFYGTSGQYNSLNNKNKLNAETVYYYSEETPTSTGRYWHFSDDGTPVMW